MFEKFFVSESRIILFVLFLVCFFDFSYLPSFLSVKSDWSLFFVLLLIYFIGYDKSSESDNTKFRRRLKYLFTGLFIFAIANCLSCYIYRQQAVWITFFHWSPIFLLFLFYPLSSLKYSVESWEKVLFSVFVLEVVAEVIQNLFPDLLLFNMTSSNEKFEEELRVRLYANAILYIGNLFCLNKALVQREHRMRFLLLYIISFVLMLLGGYRIVIAANLVSSTIMFFRLKSVFGFKSFVVLLMVLFSFALVLSKTSIVQERIAEIIERSETQNFDNEDYARIITLNHYLFDYFKSPTERLFGSGMVFRSIKPEGMKGIVRPESKYAAYVTSLSESFHIFPIDWGLLGLSWEAGIPATLILIFIAIMMIFFKTDDMYLYISSWGVFVLLFSLTNGRYYSHHNLIYTAILLVICDKLYQLKRNSAEAQ